MGSVSPSSPPTSRVTRASDVVTVDGTLDGVTGSSLVAAVTEAVAFGVRRLEIDLCTVESFDADGAAALLTCRNITSGLPDGLHYRTCPGGAGQEALLLAYADPHGTDGSAASSEAWEPAS
jgi:hypothetical protein